MRTLTLDVLLLSIFVLMVFLGWRSGVLGQLLRVVAAIVVIFATAPVSVVLRDVLVKEALVASPVIEVALMFLSAILIYVAVSLLGWLVIRLLRKTSDTLSTMDHAGGAGLGAVKATLLCYILAICGVFMLGPLERVDPEDRMHLRDGRVTAVVEQYNILAPWKFPDVERLQAAVRIGAHASSSRRAARQLHKFAAANDFIRADEFKKLLERQGLVDACKKGRMALVLADEEARAFLNEPARAEALAKVDWERIEEELGTAPAPPTSEPEEGASGDDSEPASPSPEKK